MRTTGFRYEPYEWRDASEWMLAHGPSEYQQAVILPPLFEEMNLTRAFIADIARALAGHGVSSWLPDLPGTGESLIGLSKLGWEDWRDAAGTAGEAVAMRVGRRPHVIAFRGGALLGEAVGGQSWWSFAPVPGASLLRYLQRTQLIADRNNIGQATDNSSDEYAGYALSAAMRTGLSAAVVSRPGRHRTVEADASGMLWRRAEPARDRGLSEALAADIAAWIATCEPR